MTDLRTAVFTVLKEWTLPSAVRQILEIAYYAQPEQEPVCDKDPFYCWSIRCQVGKVCNHTPSEQEPKLSDAGVDTNISLWGLKPKGSGMVALHQREWVGLTDDEIWENQGLDDLVWGRNIEAKLKEKNGG